MLKQCLSFNNLTITSHLKNTLPPATEQNHAEQLTTRLRKFYKLNSNKTAIKHGDQFFIACYKNQIIAATKLQQLPLYNPSKAPSNVLFFRGLQVSAAYQHQGIGRQLILRLDSSTPLTLCCICDETSLGFYQKLNFNQIIEATPCSDKGPHQKFTHENTLISDELHRILFRTAKQKSAHLLQKHSTN